MMHQGTRSWTAESSEKGSSSSSSSSSGGGVGGRQRLKVLYDFEYETRGKRVKIVKDEQLVLVRKTNDDWWQVVRATNLAGSYYVPEQATFYVPTGYVAQLPPRRAEGTRFYVDEDKMFKAVPDEAASSSLQQAPRKHSSDSFKNKVIRKLSGNLAQPPSSGSEANRPPVKHWDGSAFGMCFGSSSSSKNEAQLNPFQEELEHALSNRLSVHKRSARLELQAVASDSSGVEADKWHKAAGWACQRLRKVDDTKRGIQSQAVTAALPTITESKLRDASPTEKPTTGGEEHALDIINDKRKMWAIETLMSELMQSSSRTLASVNKEENEPKQTTIVSGAKQLAQELHDMSVSRRFENAEIQVNLQLDGQADWGAARCVARSPKLLDEYNEANILNEAALDSQRHHRPESPSYSSVSLRTKPCFSKPDFCSDELQLSPSLEKLASEIQFLPAAASSKCVDSDWPLQTTTISQDSLRLYKRRSKSEPQLLLSEVQQRHHLQQQQQQQQHQQSKPERKYTQYEHQRYSLRASSQQAEPLQPHQHQPYHHHHHYHNQHNSSSKYKLQRKSRSLGDLDCSDMDEGEQLELRRRYKPVPKLRSKDSLKRLLLMLHRPNTPSTGSFASTKPVPAKRRIHQQQQQQQQHHTPHSSCDDLDQVDIERSTAVGFKRLLRASDSGSEECLQSKTLTSLPTLLLFNRPHQQQHQQQNASNDNLSSSRSLSSETILSSASASSASARILDEPDLDNLVELPPGWRQIYDANAKRFCFVNDRGDKWFSSNDAEGKIYFFEENSNESSWALPTIANENRIISNGADWPQLFDGNMCILKEGLISKTKITTENGKKLRKAWSLSYAVLTELFLLFFKDAKTFAAMKMDQFAAAKPDITVDLNGAFIEPADKLSNRKNVYLINTLLGLQVLVQSDNALAITEWYKEISDAIQRLPFSQEYRRSTP